MNIPVAPKTPDMWADELSRHNQAVTRERGLAAYLVGLTFHEEDVPVFGAFEAHELFREILCDDFGWDAVDQHVIEWGDSSTPATWRVQVLPLGQVVVSRFDGSANIVAGMRVTFEGSWREIVPAALAFLAANQAG